MYRKWYPPARFVFYPLYRFLRRGWKMPCAAAYLAVWMLSGVLHGAVVLAFGHLVPAMVFALVFVTLGLVGAVAIYLKQRKRRRNIGVENSS